MSAPLAVYLRNADGWRLLLEVSDVQMTSTDPGGFASVEVDLARPLSSKMIPPFSDLLVYDRRNGEQVGGGRLLDGGRSLDASGQVWHLSGLGEGLASSADQKIPLFYIDREMGNWLLHERSTRRINASVGSPGGSSIDPGLLFEATEDRDFVTGATALMTNRLAEMTGQSLGAIGFNRREGQTGAGSSVKAVGYSDGMASGEDLYTDTWDTDAGGTRHVVKWDDWSASRSIAGFRWSRTGADYKATEDTWGRVADPVIQARVYDRDGAIRPGSFHNSETISAAQAFIDLCVRSMPRLDIATANITPSPYAFSTISEPDGITPFDLMEKLLETETAFTWAVWGLAENGYQWSTEFRSYDQTPRYYIPRPDGFTQPAPADEIRDQVIIRGSLPSGRQVATTRTRTVAALSAVNLHRTDTINLEGNWSTARANTQGDAYLAEHAEAPNGGNVTTTQPVYDSFTRRWVKPWEVRPGYKVTVGGILPDIDSSGRDTFQIVATSYTSASGAVTCELDQFSLTERRAIARLLRRR